MSEPQETSAAPSRLPVERVRAASLEVVAGPDTGRRARVDRPVFVVGKGESCDLRLSDPTVSREHVRFALTAGGLAVSDDGSKNGTLAAGLRIAQVTLLADTVLTLGGTTIAVTLDTGDTAIELSATDHFGGAFGRSSAMRHVFAALEGPLRRTRRSCSRGRAASGRTCSPGRSTRAPRAQRLRS